MAKRAISHLEIPARNRKEAAKFYQEAFGWDTESVDAMNYTTFQSANVRGGFPTVDNQQVKPGDVLFYLESDDIDADLKMIEKLGGKVLSERKEVPGRGAYAIFADPTGNRVGLWKLNRK